MDEKSRMSREWIERAWKACPNKLLSDGRIRTGPVRTAFCNVLERAKDKDGAERAWGTVLLFPDHTIPNVNMKVLMEPVNALLKEHAPAALTNPALRAKFHDPIKKQDTYINTKSETGELYAGFVAGRYAISANSSQSKPMVVDQRQAPIVDKSRIYSGCWVSAILNPGWIKRDDKKGPTYYLDSLMVLAEDESLGGMGMAGANLQEAFAGVSIDAGDIDANAAFGETAEGDVDPFA